eukprot:TRINITY_DN19390_c0_g1_i1.p1 TRINITY_DN19390_c0_g1~~TRINITY_DN19390_c0_g1_i1.p1  ORF type:complete len:182 (-),score=17.24 TRINITY_DN19390_c0_g1_i1:80-625(-)
MKAGVPVILHQGHIPLPQGALSGLEGGGVRERLLAGPPSPGFACQAKASAEGGGHSPRMPSASPSGFAGGTFASATPSGASAYSGVVGTPPRAIGANEAAVPGGTPQDGTVYSVAVSPPGYGGGTYVADDTYRLASASSHHTAATSAGAQTAYPSTMSVGQLEESPAKIVKRRHARRKMCC